jgi:hypothetical protein
VANATGLIGRLIGEGAVVRSAHDVFALLARQVKPT